MKVIVPAAVGAVIAGVAAPVVMLLAAGTAHADTGPAAEKIRSPFRNHRRPHNRK